MSRGPGRIMRAVCDALHAANGPLTFVEISASVYGTRTVDRLRRGRRRRIALPAGDTSNLRRAISGLLHRGTIVVVGIDSAAERPERRFCGRYALNDRCTGNHRERVEHGRLRAGGKTMTAGVVSEGGALVMGESTPGNDVVFGCDPVELSHTTRGPRASSHTGTPANDRAVTACEDGNSSLTRRRFPAGSPESSGSSARPTSAGVTPGSIRGALPVPARVFEWERGLLSGLVDDLFKELSHAPTEDDDSDA